MTVIRFDRLERAGRLGNQAIQVAACAGLAAKHDARPWFPRPWSYAEAFNVPPEWFGKANRPQPGEEVVDVTELAEVQDTLDPRARPYLQALGFWEDIADDVRGWFTPSAQACELLDAHLLATGQTYLPGLLADPETIVLHVRRGDNADPVTHPVGTWPLVTMDYYREALALMEPRDTVVFSDDPDWCDEVLFDLIARWNPGTQISVVHSGPQRSPEYGKGSRYRDEPPHDWIDLALMAMGSRFITSNSTYSLMAAWLSGFDDVVVCDNWVGYLLSDWIEPEKLWEQTYTMVHNPVGAEHLAP